VIQIRRPQALIACAGLVDEPVPVHTRLIEGLLENLADTLPTFCVHLETQSAGVLDETTGGKCPRPLEVEDALAVGKHPRQLLYILPPFLGKENAHGSAVQNRG